MSVYVPDATIDAMLDVIADDVTKLHICSTQPTNYTEANATYELGNVTVSSGVGGGDWTQTDGDTSGRKITMAEQTGINIDTTGTALHIAGTNGSDTLYFVTTVTSQGVNSGNTATINTFDIEVQDAS